MIKKQCGWCKEKKPLIGFYKRADGSGLAEYACIACRITRNKELRDQDPEHFRKYDKARNQLPARKKQVAARTLKEYHMGLRKRSKRIIDQEK